MNVAMVNRLNNQYQALVNQAEMLLLRNAGMHSNDEGLCYQKAAEICGQLAAMNIGAEQQHWINQQQKCQQQMRVIWASLHPEEISKPKENSSTEGNGNEKTNQTEKPRGKKSEVDRSIIENWYLEEMPRHSLDEILGFDEEKKKLRNCISTNDLKELSDYLELPSVHSFFFYGPPGCGKTYVITGFIHELMDKGYKCLKVSSADIHAKFSGEADKRLEALFDEAISQDKCVIFVDEIDGICQNREIPNLADHNMQLTTTFLNCFNKLVEAGKQKKSVFFFSATNYPANVDSAMLDRVMLIQIPLPDEALREGLFRNLLNRVRLDPEISFADFAEKSEGYSVRDIERIVGLIKQLVFSEIVERYSSKDNTAGLAVEALKNGEFVVTREMLDEAFGAYKPKPMTDVERSLIEFESRA